MAGQMPQGPFGGNRSMYNQLQPQPQQQQQSNFGINRSHQGHLDDIAGHGQGVSMGVGASHSANPAAAAATKEPPNTATICRIGQETIQEIVTRIQEVFSYLKSLQLPVGSPAQDRATLEKQQRLQEVLKGITQLFKRLTLCYERAQEQTGGMEYTQIESLIPLKDDRDIKSELEKKRGESYRSALEEHNELVQQLTQKNRILKEIIDSMRGIIWEINTMLAMRDAQT